MLDTTKKSVGNSIRVNIPGQNLLNTAPSSSPARRGRKIKRCVFPLRNISAETLPGRRPLTSTLPREPMTMDETVSHPAFLRIAVGISPLVMIPTFTLTINPRCSGKFFPSSSWILAFSLCASCVHPCLVCRGASTTCWRTTSCIPGILVRHTMVFFKVFRKICGN